MGNAASKGKDAYSMKLTYKNMLGEGVFGAVYKIMTKIRRQQAQLRSSKFLSK